jgi:hypothetical protein
MEGRWGDGKGVEMGRGDGGGCVRSNKGIPDIDIAVFKTVADVDGDPLGV